MTDVEFNLCLRYLAVDFVSLLRNSKVNNPLLQSLDCLVHSYFVALSFCFHFIVFSLGGFKALVNYLLEDFDFLLLRVRLTEFKFTHQNKTRNVNVFVFSMAMALTHNQEYGQKAILISE